MRLFTLIFLLFCQTAWSQTEYHFSKLTVEDGLPDSHVQAIGQDKFGFIWLGTSSGVSRFDGRNIVSFNHDSDDTTTILSEMAHCFGSDTEGRFFVGFFNGLAEFDFITRRFHRIAIQNKNVTSITPIDKNLILLTTSGGLAALNPKTRTTEFLKHDSLLTIGAASSFYKNGILYIGSDKGLLLYNPKTHAVQKAPIPALEGSVVRAVVVDNKNNIWVTDFAHCARFFKNRYLRQKSRQR
jgi:ligand-binding sensor domain-containing protein